MKTNACEIRSEKIIRKFTNVSKTIVMRPTVRLLSALLSLLMLGACKYDNEEDLYGKTNNPVADCDTSLVRFSSDIKTIINVGCIECHGKEPLGDAAPYTNYDEIKKYLDTKKQVFLESITHTGSADPMPDGRAKLPDCEINKIVKWVNNGYPNN